MVARLDLTPGAITHEPDWGLSSDILVVQDQALNPCMVAKFNTGFITRGRAEAAALDHLEHLEMPAVPRILGRDESGGLLLSWLNGVPSSEAAPLSFFESAGRWLGLLHSQSARESQMKFSSDPLELGARMLKQLSREVPRIENPDLRELASKALVRIEQDALHLENPHRFVHRDLRPPNWLISSDGEFVGVVDFEHAASSHPAWDFVKLNWWFLRDQRAREAFYSGYENVAELPARTVCAIFELFESAMMLSFFEKRNPEYITLAVATLERHSASL